VEKARVPARERCKLAYRTNVAGQLVLRAKLIGLLLLRANLRAIVFLAVCEESEHIIHRVHV
jgi:hypothetical protein